MTTRMNPPPPILLLAASAAILAAEDKPVSADVYALGVSAHIFRQDGRSYNGRNYGAGLGVSSQISPSVDVVSLGMAFRNSYNYTSTAIAVGARYTLGGRDGWHASGAAMGGIVCYRRQIPVILPILGAGYGPVSIETTALPGPHATAIAAWLRISIPVN